MRWWEGKKGGRGGGKTRREKEIYYIHTYVKINFEICFAKRRYSMSEVISATMVLFQTVCNSCTTNESERIATSLSTVL